MSATPPAQWKIQQELRDQRRAARKRPPAAQAEREASPYTLIVKLADASKEGRRRAYERLRLTVPSARYAYHGPRQEVCMRGVALVHTTTRELGGVLATLAPEWVQGRKEDLG